MFQGIEVLAEPWNLSEAVQRTIHVLLGIGFFVTIVLAWYHGEKGRQRASGVELLILAGILVIAGAAVALLGRGPQGEVAGEYEAPTGTLNEMSIAALPFANRSGLEEDLYFTDGIHDEILTLLSKISSLSVRGRTSVMQYRDTDKNLRQIGQELNARYILEGGVQRAGGTVRINLQLLDTERDEHVWAETYDRPLTVENLLGVQSEVALRVAEALKATLTPQEAEEIEQRPTDNLEAYEYYLRGNDYVHRTGEERARRAAIQMYQNAVELDPDFAVAFARLSEQHSFMYFTYFDRTEERLDQAKRAVDISFRLVPQFPEAHRAMGFFYYWGRLDYDRALEQFEIALESQPNSAWILAGMAYVQRRQGRLDQSLLNLEKAVELDPLAATLLLNLGVSYILDRRYPEAVRHLDRALALTPDFIEPYYRKAHALLSLNGSTQEALAVLEQASLVVDGKTNSLLALAYVLYRAFEGRFQEAIALLDSVAEGGLDNQFRVVPKSLLAAQVYSWMNQPETARAYYDTARSILEGQLQETPGDHRVHSSLGLAYAGLGQKEDAIGEGTLGVELMSATRDAFVATFRVEDLARIYTMVGEQGAAIDRLDYLLSIPGQLSVNILPALSYLLPVAAVGFAESSSLRDMCGASGVLGRLLGRWGLLASVAVGSRRYPPSRKSR